MKKILLIVLLITISMISYSEKKEKTFDLIIRFGQGGFSDSRSDLNSLGGGEFTFDIKHKNYPLTLSYSGEYYTNGPDPSHSYEISSMNTINLLYLNKLKRYKRLSYFAGGGLAIIHVPKDNVSGTNKTLGYNLELGLNFKVYKALGIYGMYKYLYAHKEKDSIAIIDFDENIILIGFTLNFSF